jgi:hypothetical protein
MLIFEPLDDGVHFGARLRHRHAVLEPAHHEEVALHA